MALSISTLAFIEGIGGPEMGMILILVLVLFGGQKLPEFARGLGKSMREFKKAASGVEQEFKRALEEEPPKPYEPPAASLASATTPEPMPAQDYHDDPYHHDSHYSHDGSEAGPSSSAAPDTAPPAVPAASAETPLDDTGLPALDLPKAAPVVSDAAPVAAPPATPAAPAADSVTPPSPEPKP